MILLVMQLLIKSAISLPIERLSINLQQSHSEGVINEHDKELLKERYIYIYIYIYPEERQKFIDDLRLI